MGGGNRQKDECSDPVVDIPVAEIIVHEYYDPSAQSPAHEIALIRLERAAPITTTIRLICLPIQDAQNKNYDGSVMTATGFHRQLGEKFNGMKLAP